MQAMPQLTDRSKLPNIVDPVIKDTMDLKHLYQVCELYIYSVMIGGYNLCTRFFMCLGDVSLTQSNGFESTFSGDR